MRFRFLILLVLSGAFGCGANVRCGDDSCAGEEEPDDPAEQCEAGGGEWRVDGCLGRFDHCGITYCELGEGEGCGCGEDACWDGEACVSHE